MTAEPSEDDLDKMHIYYQLDEYPWDQDEEFQGGLRAILGSVQDPAQVDHLTLRAKCYYYARKYGTRVDFGGYEQWIRSGRGSTSHEAAGNARIMTNGSIVSNEEPAEDDFGGARDAPKPASFAEICKLIAEGKPIPGIKDIPDTILEDQATTSEARIRKKPWEKESAAKGGETPSWMT